MSDAQSTGATSGGMPIPNADSIQEFKVQTALYGVAYRLKDMHATLTQWQRPILPLR